MDNSKKLQEMQIIEQSLQATLMQKQAFQIELDETLKASDALKNSGDEVYKIVGQLMLKINKKEAEEENSKKKEILELRIKSLDRQEHELAKKMDDLRSSFTQTQK
jgi:prefoldin beta subunit